jgi:uncharacterized protein (DUF427 family)
MSMKMQDHLSRIRGELRHQPIEQRVRGYVDGEAVVDSRRAILVWEPRRVVPSYAVPAEDILAELAESPASSGEVAGVLHPRIPFSVHTAAGSPVFVGDRSGAGFRLDDEDLDGYVELDFTAFDEWYEEDERIEGHPRDPYHRVDVRRSARAVRIEVEGEVIAETTDARLLYETSLPMRFYLPREDVRTALHPSSMTTYCPYKGHASYWSVDAGGRRREALGWSYEEPLPDGPPVAGLIAFWDDRVDVYVDGSLRPRPGGAIAAALADEFRA